MSRPRNVYQIGTDIFLMCRVCLTQSKSNMYDLDEEFEIDSGAQEKMLVVEALQKVTSAKVTLNKLYPNFICPMCLSLLKMSFKFISQFEESQLKLKEIYDSDDINDFPNEHDRERSTQNKANVEVIYNNKQFNLNDLLVVEPATKEKLNFNGFLKNLGNEISATFADGSDRNNLIKSEDEGFVTVLIKVNNRCLPVKELLIDEDANLVNFTVDESIQEIDQSVDPENLFEDNKNDIEEENDGMESVDPEISFEGDENDMKVENDGLESEANNPPNRTIRKFAKIKEKQEPENINEDDIFEKEIKFPCETCGGIFSKTKLLKAHIRRAHYPKAETFTCEICGYINNTRSAYVNHKMRHKGKKFICNICQKPYYTKSVLKVHMETHTNDRKHLCSVCGKGFNYANALVYHMRLHTGEKNYKCEYCDKSFRMSNSLRRHVRVHTGEKPYRCRYCDKQFCSKGELSCHENIHTGFRPYHCKYCKKGFSKTHNLKVHLLTHDGPHECEICSRTFIEMSILAMHYKISHKNLLPTDEDVGEED